MSRMVAVEIPLIEFSWRQRNHSARTSTKISWRHDAEREVFIRWMNMLITDVFEDMRLM